MRISIAALVVGALLVGTANAAPPEAPRAGKHRVVTCEQARPGTKLWKRCHRRAPPRVVKEPRAPRRPAPADLPPPQR